MQLPFDVLNQMPLTGDLIDVESGHEVGFFNVLGDPGGALEAALGLADRIVLNSPDTIARETVGREVRSWERTATADAEIAESPDRVEGVTAFFEKRPPSWV